MPIKQKRRPLFTIVEVCFALVVAGALFSIFGLIDAFVAADLIIFEALNGVHAVVFGTVMSVVAATGIIGSVALTPGNSLSARMEPEPKNFTSSVNLKLDAERLQAMLHVLRYPVRIDGIFGLQTEEMIREFQEDTGLAVDGIVGSLTLEALQKQVERLRRTDWVGQILSENPPPPVVRAPVLSLVGAPRSK